jgi:AcrR family transcriptional regulator
MSAKTALHLPREAAIDRRVARTRMALCDALVALIPRKNYDAITLGDILAEANVGRSTFYQHFKSKDDLLARSLERLKAALLEAQGAEAGPAGIPWGFSRTLFEHVGEYRDIHFALSGTEGARILDAAIGAVLAGLLRDWLPAERMAAAMPRDLAVRYMVATFTTVMTWWFERAPGTSAAEADETFRRLVTDGLANR